MRNTRQVRQVKYTKVLALIKDKVSKKPETNIMSLIKRNKVSNTLTKSLYNKNILQKIGRSKYKWVGGEVNDKMVNEVLSNMKDIKRMYKINLDNKRAKSMSLANNTLKTPYSGLKSEQKVKTIKLFGIKIYESVIK